MITRFFARKESKHSVIQTIVQLMVILGFHNRETHNYRISTNVFPQVHVAVGITNLSAVDPY